MRIKQQPEDFTVEELSPQPLGAGEYTWFTLKKRNLGTLEALHALAERWHVPFKRFGFAGLKDKHAVTTQVCSFKGVVKDFKERDMEIRVVGTSDIPVSLGSHRGNAFTIVVRDLEQAPQHKHVFINYFGEQRFSTNNAAIGKAIVKGDYAKAVELAIASGMALEPGSQGLAALKKLPLKLLRLFVHAYQSKLWNEVVREHELHGAIPEELPLVGFGSDTSDELVQEQLKNEGITPRSFVLKSFPELSEEGTTRNVHVHVTDLTLGPIQDDELNAGRKKIKVTFTLPPGSYATEIIRQLFSQAPQESA
ncbi:MAG TPA: tRNA pseudouridine(13) synthase TruD [Candidatus Binatia bacterium]|nr:tRNA pseudouridine(13) synthase TruD [Candidatus Binatia bacterium]